MNSASKRRKRAGKCVQIAKTGASAPFGYRPDRAAVIENVCDGCGAPCQTLLKVRGERICVRCAVKRAD